MTYGTQVWGQFQNMHVKRISKLNDKAIRLMNFAKYHEDPSEYYKKLNILKFQDSIKLNNFLHVHDHFNYNLPNALLDKFEYVHRNHDYKTMISTENCVKVPKSNTSEYRIHSVVGQASRHWNLLHVTLSKKLHQLPRNSCKEIISKHLIDSY